MKTIYYCISIIIVIILIFLGYQRWYYMEHVSLAISQMKNIKMTSKDCHYAASIFIDLLENGYKKEGDDQLYTLSESLICPPDCRGILEKEKQTIESYYPEKPKITCPIDTPNN